MKTSAGLTNLAEQLTGKSKPLVAQFELCFLATRVKPASLLGESQQSSLPCKVSFSIHNSRHMSAGLLDGRSEGNGAV